MTITVHGPGGITVHFPDGTDSDTIDQVMTHAIGGGQAEPGAASPDGKGDRLPMAPGAVPHAMPADTVSGGGPPPDEGALSAATGGVGDMLSFGLMDEASAAGAATLEPLVGMFVTPKRPMKGSWGERYDEALSAFRAKKQAAEEQHPVATIAGDIGGIAAAVPRAVAAGGAGLLTRMASGAKVGAGFNAAYGFGSGEDGLGNRLTSAAEGGVTGALTGAALPVVGGVLRTATKPIVDAVAARIRPAAYAARKVAERLGAGGRSVGSAAHRMAEAAANGDDLSLLDVGGKQVQRLARTITNAGGPGGSKLMSRANLEAMGQGGRLAAKVDEGLGVPGLDYQEAKVAIMDARSHAAEPFYQAFYQTPVPFTRRLEEVLNTPAGRAGLAAARTNSMNRREPWAQWFLNVTEDGRIINARRVPDARALDEVRRVIRGHMEEAMANPSGGPFARPRETPRSRAIRSVYDDLSDEMMAAGETRPGARDGPFAHANQAGLDNIQADDAIEFGRNILHTDPRVIQRRMGGGGAGRDRVFNEGQQEIVRIGAAEAIKHELGATDFTRNGLLKFFSSREDIARLRPLFRSPEDWQRFRTSMFNEARKRAKYDAIKSNSTTAQQLADMQEAGQLADVVQTGIHAAHSGVLPAAAGAVMRGLRRLGGLTPEVGDQIARIVSTRNPAEVQRIIRQLDRIAVSQASRAQKLNAARNLLTAVLATQEGRALAAPQGAQ